jgi:hypothetical protein
MLVCKTLASKPSTKVACNFFCFLHQDGNSCNVVRVSWICNQSHSIIQSCYRVLTQLAVSKYSGDVCICTCTKQISMIHIFFVLSFSPKPYNICSSLKPLTILTLAAKPNSEPECSEQAMKQSSYTSSRRYASQIGSRAAGDQYTAVWPRHLLLQYTY